VKRQIIKIDEEKCNGCGDCVPNCPEGALQIIDGKARLVGDLLCDGLGACIGKCPQGAITIEEREAEKYDEVKVIENVAKGGEKVILSHLNHLKEHDQSEFLEQALKYLNDNNISIPSLEEKKKEPVACGFPGTMMKDFRRPGDEQTEEAASITVKSELRQWPTQLHLVNPGAPYFQDCDLLVAADCVAFSLGDFHFRFLKGKSLVMFCPKLDSTMDLYLEKLTAIIRDNNIRSITVAKMEVPCCYGSLNLTREAVKNSGKNILIKEHTVSIRGDVS